MKVLKEEKCDVAFLCVDDYIKLGKLYEGVGFVLLKRKYKATGASGKIFMDEEGMIASVNSPKIFEEIVNDSEIFDLYGQDW